jgi:glycosyltransferase involved in cell wall biosynthesis
VHPIERRSEPVLLVSPDLRPSVLGVARALQHGALLRGFVTGMALPTGAVRVAERLRLKALPAAFRSRVLPSWLEVPTELVWRQDLLNQVARRAGLPEVLTHALWRRSEPAFDARVARRWAGRVPCIYGIENASVETFEAQRRSGGATVLWQVIAHPATLQRVEAAQLQAQPSANDAYARVRERDRAWVDARKQRQFAASDLIVCNSPFVRDSFVQAGVESARLACVPTACPTPGDDRLAEPSRDPRVLLFAGPLSLRKGVVELLQAFRALQPRAGVELWLAGKPTLPVHLLGELPPGVRLLGHVSHGALLDLMRRATLFVLPSWAEGRSHAVLEALSVGLPCVTTAASGCTDLVVDGQTGRIVPAGDAPALARALAQCLDDPQALRTMAGRCLEAARAWNATAFERAHSQVLRELLAGRDGPAAPRRSS